MARKCPECGERSALQAVARPEYDPLAPQLAGGVLLALVFALSRRRRFRCGRCRRLFETHTVASRGWWLLWVLFWAGLALAVVGLMLGGRAR